MRRWMVRVVMAAIVTVPVWGTASAMSATAAQATTWTGIWLTNSATFCEEYISGPANLLVYRPCTLQYAPEVLGNVRSGWPFTTSGFNAQFAGDPVFKFPDSDIYCLGEQRNPIFGYQVVDEQSCTQAGDEWVANGTCSNGVMSGVLISVNYTDAIGSVQEMSVITDQQDEQLTPGPPGFGWTNWSFNTPYCS
jgi:hypothetical protein